MNLLAGLIGSNASDNIASTSYNWAPTERQQFLWRLRMLHSNELHCAIPKSSSTQSVFAICLCIQLHNYACNVLQIWFFACCCRVNIQEPAVCYTVTLLSAVFRVELPRSLILTTISDAKSFNTSLLEVMISSKNERVFIRDLSNLTLKIIFDAWWASMNVGSEQPIAWNDSRHGPLWWFYLHCGIEDTGSPGNICIVCHQVLCHPSEHGTSSMGKHLVATAHIAKLNELPESEVSELTSTTVNETALAILKTQGSRGITIVCSQSQIIFDVQSIPYWLKW